MPFLMLTMQEPVRAQEYRQSVLDGNTPAA